MKMSSFAVDKKLVEDGVWCPIAIDAKVRVARSNNERYRGFLRALMKPFNRQLQRNTAESEALAKELMIKAIGRYILLDWEGITDEDGNVIEYSETKAIEILTEYPEFYDLISELSADASMYQAIEKEDAVKNSKITSDGETDSEIS